MKYLFVIAGKNVKTHHALVRLQTGFNHSFSLNDFYMTYLSLYHTAACPPHAPTDAPALKTSAHLLGPCDVIRMECQNPAS